MPNSSQLVYENAPCRDKKYKAEIKLTNLGYKTSLYKKNIFGFYILQLSFKPLSVKGLVRDFINEQIERWSRLYGTELLLIDERLPEEKKL